MPVKSRKILIFTTGYRPLVGGSELALENIIRRLPSIFFHILTPRYNRQVPKIEQGDNFLIERLGLGWPPDKYLFPVLSAAKVLLMTYDVINKLHAYQASFGGGGGWLVKIFRPKLKFIVTLQEGKTLAKQNRLIKFLRGLILKKADVITAISNYLADYAKKINPRAQIVVIPNGVDLESIKYKVLSIKEPKNNERIIITVSRLVPKNGVADLIDAFHILYTKYKIQNTNLLIVGDGPLEENLKLKVKSLKLENSIKFLGEIAHEKLPRYLAAADVFVRPSLSEGLGTAFLEAMAAGLPIVGTPVGGIPDFLKDGKTGLFCQPGEATDIADKIIKLLSDEALRREIGQKGRSLVEKNYNWQTIAEKFKTLYD